MSSQSFDERLRLAALVLRIAANKAEGIHLCELEKLTVLKHPRQCATHGKFQNSFRFLLRNGYLIRFSRGVYGITAEGLKFLEGAPK